MSYQLAIGSRKRKSTATLLDRMLDQLRAGDVVVVWKLDRLSRSLKELSHRQPHAYANAYRNSRSIAMRSLSIPSSLATG